MGSCGVGSQRVPLQSELQSSWPFREYGHVMDAERKVEPAHVTALINARARYVESHYDEVLHEVAARIEARSSVGKTDIGALLFWKRLRANATWVLKLMVMGDDDVRAITASAVAAVNDQGLSLEQAAHDGRAALTALPGFKSGDALASAVLFAAAPERMAVYDRQAHRALTELKLDLDHRSGRYGRYMRMVELVVTAVNESDASHHWIPRDAVLALYALGGPAPNQQNRLIPEGAWVNQVTGDVEMLTPEGIQHLRERMKQVGNREASITLEELERRLDSKS